jgi:signal transduction histidine kinase
MIGAAVLAAGLLLIVTALFAARIPGWATFARPGISNPVRAFLLSPIHPTTWDANWAILVGLLTGGVGAAAIFSLASLGLSTLLAVIGVLFLVLAIEGSRLLARIERRRLFVGEPVRPVAHPYRPLRGGVVAVLRAAFADESRWRDVIYVAINLPLSVLEFAAVGVVWTAALGLLTSPVWYDLVPNAPAVDLLGPLSGHDGPSILLRALGGAALLGAAASLSQVIVALHRGLVAILLCTSAERALRQQVEVLRESRAAVLDVEASELHRIERDLHDGAQQRLVALTIDLGRASERLETDPAAARALIRDGQAQAQLALAELRDLVRGIAPSILLDRGVVPAIESISGGGGVATRIVSGLGPGQRFAPAIERAAYFVAAEALANVAKHSGATRCDVRVQVDAGRLVVEIEDDGTGGATATPNGGLAGLRRRVEGVDGRFEVESPAGGPTVIRATFPLVAGGASDVGGAVATPAVPPPGQEPR